MNKALDDIVRRYLISETYGERPEKENPKTSSQDDLLDNNDDWIKPLYECLESKGIIRELQAFLRQRLVAVLQDKWPNLTASAKEETFHPVAVILFQDFLCCHNLLYTFSVLASEIDYTICIKNQFGKMPCIEAENVLHQMDIKRESVLSREVLKCYSDKEQYSLLECIIYLSSWMAESPYRQHLSETLKETNYGRNPNQEALADRLNKVDALFDDKINKRKKESKFREDEVENRLRAMESTLEKEKEIQLQHAVTKFKEEEATRLRDEIETRLKYEMLGKERELLQSYEERVSYMKKTLEREKELWLVDKGHQEMELLQHREKLVKLMETVTEKQQMLKDLLDKYQDGNTKTSKLQSIPTADENVTEYSTSGHTERVSYLKEARLISAMEKLMDENRALKRSNQSSSSSIPQKNGSPAPDPNSTMMVKKADSISAPGLSEDTVAFLQYSLERQAEEIEVLKRKSQQSEEANLARKYNYDLPFMTSGIASPPNNQNKRDAELDIFLSSSKKRCEEIEREARDIEKSLIDFHRRSNSGTSAIAASMISNSSYRPHLPKLPFDVTNSKSSSSSHMYFPTLLQQNAYIHNNEIKPLSSVPYPGVPFLDSLTNNGCSSIDLTPVVADKGKNPTLHYPVEVPNSVLSRFSPAEKIETSASRIMNYYKQISIPPLLQSSHQTHMSQIDKGITNKPIYMETPDQLKVLKTIPEVVEKTSEIKIRTSKTNVSSSTNENLDSRGPYSTDQLKRNLPMLEKSISLDKTVDKPAGGDTLNNNNQHVSQNSISDSESEDIMRVRARHSGALITDKLPSPPSVLVSEGRDRDFQKLAFSNKTRVENPGKDIIEESRKEDDTASEAGIDKDLSISAPEISQAGGTEPEPADFWNI